MGRGSEGGIREMENESREMMGSFIGFEFRVGLDAFVGAKGGQTSNVFARLQSHINLSVTANRIWCSQNNVLA